MKIHDVVQGTTAWAALRAGIPTASEFEKIVTPKGEPSASAHKYMCKLLAERISGQPIDGFTSEWMARGSEMEHKAVEAWEFVSDCTTERIGFVTTDDGKAGASPDRLIVERPAEIMEVKCPSLPVHVQYLLAAAGKGIDKEYKIQTQGQLFICEKEINTLISFHPDIKGAEVRLNRDEVFITTLQKRLAEFIAVLEENWLGLVASGLVEERAEAAKQKPQADDPLFLNDDDLAVFMKHKFGDDYNVGT